MSIILHITETREWEEASRAGSYAPASLAVEGFIHCSTLRQTVSTANAFFRGRADLVLLVIDVGRLEAELRYEAPADVADARAEQSFPHLYGALNFDAVVGIHPLVPDDDGGFHLPAGLITEDKFRTLEIGGGDRRSRIQLPTLETRRLILRAPVRDDFDAFAAFMADERTAKYVGGVLPRSMAWRQFAAVAGSWLLNGYSMFSVVEKATGAWIGRSGPWMPEGWPGTEVGWGILASAQRQGYATEAAAAAIDWAFDTLGWVEVIHCIEPANTASIATAHKLGSTLLRTGVAAPAPLEIQWDIYGQTRAQWFARRARGPAPLTWTAG